MQINLTKSLACAVLITGFMLLLSACGGPDSIHSGSNIAGRVFVNVGDSATCYAAGSCKVYMNMPQGSGSYVVKQSGPNGNWTAGTFNAGEQEAYLGEFYAGRTELTIEGQQFPSTWITVISDI